MRWPEYQLHKYIPYTTGSFRFPAPGQDVPGSCLIFTCWFHSDWTDEQWMRVFDADATDDSGINEIRLRWSWCADVNFTFITSPKGTDFWLPPSDAFFLFRFPSLSSSFSSPICSQFRPLCTSCSVSLERLCPVTESAVFGISKSFALLAKAGCCDEACSTFTLHWADAETALVGTTFFCNFTVKWLPVQSCVDRGNVGNMSSELLSNAAFLLWVEARRFKASSSELSMLRWAWSYSKMIRSFSSRISTRPKHQQPQLVSTSSPISYMHVTILNRSQSFTVSLILPDNR